MSITIHESKPPISESHISEIEVQQNIVLPKDYRSFLLKHNGGYPEPDGFLIPGRGDDADGMVDRFLAIHDGEPDNLKRYLKWYAGRIPDDLFPVAHDPGGNLILISVKGDNIGKVYYWDHEEEEDPDSQKVYYVADNFDDFLNGLREI